MEIRECTDGRFLALSEERDGRLRRLLVLAGDHFLYVRNRERDLPAAESIDALVRTTNATRAQVIAFLDCEFSYGRVRGGPCAVERSSGRLSRGERDVISSLYMSWS